MIKTLGELGDITVGYQMRQAITPDSLGYYRLLQLRNVQDGTLDLSDVSRTMLPDTKDLSRYSVKPGDVMIRSRGANYGAAAVELDDLPANTVVVAPLFRLRPDAARVLPAYLAWFINRAESQAFLRLNEQGSVLPAVGLAGFRSLPVIVPALSVQAQIIEIVALAKRERELINQQQDARDRQIAATLERILTNTL